MFEFCGRDDKNKSLVKYFEQFETNNAISIKFNEMKWKKIS